MKKLFLFLIPVLLFACTNKNFENTAIVSGKIANPTTDFVYISLNDKTDTAKIREDGTFYTKVNIEKPFYGTIRSGEYSNIFLSPGDSVYIELDTKEFDETITYSGIGAEFNNYLAKKLLIEAEATSSPSELYKLDEENFKEKIDSVKQTIIGLYNKIPVSNKVFNNLEPKSIDYSNAALLLNYPKYHKYYAKDTTYVKSETLWKFLETIEIENADYWQLNSYKDFFSTYFSNGASEIYDSEKELQERQDGYTLAQFEFIKSKMTDPTLKSKKAGATMYNYVRFYNTDSIDELMTEFLSLCKDTVRINDIKIILEKKKKIAKGMPAPNFETVDVNNNPVNLTDYKGKYVYVDFWASWCGPCRQEIPYFKTLTSDFKDKNIAFLSVSVDAKKDAWEEAIVTHELSGNLLYAGSNDIIRNEYMVYSIPRFVLIDPEGNFIDSNAPRPSSEEIRNLFKHAFQ